MTALTKKQYVLSSAPLSLADMTCYAVGNAYLYTDEGLNVTSCTTADGKDVLLLGYAFCMDSKGKQPQEDIQAFAGDDFTTLTQYWTGRFVLVTENTLIRDAAGLMGAFYYKNGTTFMVSSSLALLSELLGEPPSKSVNRTGLTWQLLPKTVLPSVRAMLCTQSLIFNDSGVQIVPFMWMTDARALSTDEKCRRIAELLENGAYNVGRYAKRRIVVALTGGKDSRLTFAAFVRAGIEFEAYTAEHDAISVADKTMPARLCNLFDKPYIYVKKKRFHPEKLRDYKKFTLENIDGVDALFYARGQYSLLEDALIVRSSLYEAGQTYNRSIAGSDEDSFIRGMRGYCSELKTDPYQAEAFADWLEIFRETPDGFVDIRDRFYIEQRVGGWVAAIEQSLDINDSYSLQIANCAALLSVLLSANETERKELALSYETMRLLEPKVLTLPVNQKTWRDKIAYGISLFRNPFVKIKKLYHKMHNGR